ncbi:MAG: hypothetical protein HY925_09985 [Elusimicrobia bacterium]|nr:hypothetical protein [Elusimicrobiota bacterium]
MAEDDLKDNAPWLVILLTFGVAIVAMLGTLWFKRSSEPEYAQAPTFDRPKPAAPEATPVPAEVPSQAPEAPPPSASGLLVVQHSLPPARPAETPEPASTPPRAPAAPPPQAKAGSFHELVMTEKVKMKAVWDKHVGKSKVLQAYVKEWNSTPELKALKEQWHKNYDPIAFLKGVAGEPKFFSLLAKYGRSTEFVSVLKDDMKVVSPQAMDEANKVLSKDSTIKILVDKVGGAMGVPLGAWLGGKPPSQDDIIKSMLKNNPGLQDPRLKK